MKRLMLLLFLTAQAGGAQNLQEVTVTPTTIKSPDFVEGAFLGNGVIEKEFVIQQKEGPQRKVKNSKRLRVGAVKPAVKLAVKIVRNARSIASYPEDTKFGNEFISHVREKDASDREETLRIVRASIERGEFGAAAKAKLENEK